MKLSANWRTWKITVGIALGLLLLADVTLGVFLSNASRQGPDALREERSRLALQAKLLRADLRRGEAIRASLPQVGLDCAAFYRESFLDSKTGYSDIESDLGAIAQKSNVRTPSLSFDQKPVKDRGVTEVSIRTTVDADYPSIVRFINGLERSKNFYLVDGLRLASASTGAIQLQIEMHTYFRT
ncbi:MAG TPA: GspMb/PilO family protein [Candidatus Aquilonibacter sp.]|nr:GspMb/PilO family protein [Candidatus Aquilonibacter sp.]